ncbi:probable LRR receptor-like serine/threonine-protein kinase At3g47570 [Camellia sinensis]|uniref:probable LRR receptor-like serine/threonine-protein kinase At3g47570 n=1 Tax=Camellia sinensis TaxID=4442 RepID=UPI001035E784|nr:probable LRR receptor-like serine/threonine-protein kinase At3g47570 [Camellia sinensis]
MLQELYLYRNKISGKIPTSFGNMSKLSLLSLYHNILEGSIPGSLGNCINLQGLDLSYNRFTGTIPEQIVALPSLTIENQLSGNIPSTLGDCLVLEFLYMEGNHFEGTIPPSFKQLRGIQELGLSNNNFPGKIPSFLGDFSLIQYLNLSYNKFEGEVPSKGVFSNISAFSIGGNNKLCGGNKALQLPACPTKSPNKQGKHFSNRVLIIAISVPVCIILLLACICATLYWNRRRKERTTSTSSLGNQYPNISYAELLQATEGFSSRNLIGEGSYGSVYKGILNCDVARAIAVKVLNLQVRGASKSFLAECEALKNIRHRNLVKVVTACSSIDFKGNEFKALVFEYISNGSLESWLHSSRSSNNEDSRNLNLVQRLNIAVDAASALDYLHNHCETPIIHCDLKLSNVLLDDDLLAV